MSVIIAPVQESLAAYIASRHYSKTVVIVDQNTYEHCYPKVKDTLPVHTLIEVPAGEEHKTLQTCEGIWGAMTDHQLDRHALVINLGGGVIGDMGGFCAATYKRGIDFVQLPTTLLAQVDASVGGKLGIDFRGFKNHIGVFTQPQRVLIDTAFLETLPKRELRSGFAEVIKHCLIRDAAMLDVIFHKTLEEQDFAALTRHSVAIKEAIVAEDPTEKGLRKILNFGHTVGHAVETYFLDKGDDKLLHGEAIAVGMMAEAHISFQKGLLDEKTIYRINELLSVVYGKVVIPENALPELLAHAAQDKKNRNNDIRASLLDGIGSCRFDMVVTQAEIAKSIGYYNQSV